MRAQKEESDIIHAAAWIIRSPVMLAITLLALVAFLAMDLHFWRVEPVNYGLTARSAAIGFSAACASVGGVIPAVGTLVRVGERMETADRWKVTAKEGRTIRIVLSIVVLLIISVGIFAVSTNFAARFSIPLMVLILLPEICLARGIFQRRVNRTGEAQTGDP